MFFAPAGCGCAGVGDKDDDENVLVVKFLAFLDVISRRPSTTPHLSRNW